MCFDWTIILLAGGVLLVWLLTGWPKRSPDDEKVAWYDAVSSEPRVRTGEAQCPTY